MLIILESLIKIGDFLLKIDLRESITANVFFEVPRLIAYE